MYKSKNVQTKNTFNAVFSNDDGKEFDLAIYSPKLSVLNSLEELDSAKPSEICECFRKIINHNKNGITFTFDEIADMLDIDEMMDFLNEFFDWINSIKKK